MTLTEKLTIVALVFGPVIAVGITLWIEARRRTQENRLRIIRMLLATRHIPAHPDYCSAINLLPLEFNNESKVMSAWRAYNERVRQDPKLHDHETRVRAAQSTMIYEAMACAKLKLSEADIQTQAYISEGFVKRDEIYVNFLLAMPEIAEAMRAQVANSDKMLQAVLAARNPSQQPPNNQNTANTLQVAETKGTRP
jgi:hypothetical protein